MRGHTCAIEGALSHEATIARQADARDEASHVAAPAAELISVGLGGSLTPRQVLALQGAIGNRAVANMLRREPTAPQTIGGVVPPMAAKPPGVQAVADARAGDWRSALETVIILANPITPRFLDALEEFRHAGLLPQVTNLLTYAPVINRARLKVGLLAVGAPPGFRLAGAEDAAKLTPDERKVITDHMARQKAAGDVVGPITMKRWDGQTFSKKDPDITDISWIERFLEFFGFGPPPGRDPPGTDPGQRSARLNRHWTKIDEVMDIVQQQGVVDGRALSDQDIRNTVNLRYDRGFERLKGRQWSVTLTFVPATGHTGLSSKGLSVDKPAAQLGGQLIWQFHHPDEPGLELSVVAQLTMFKDPGPDGKFRVQNVLAGGQAAWVVPFAQGWLQAQAFVQVLGGLAYSGDTRSFNASTAQGAFGAQIAVFPGGQQTFFIALQGTAGFTGTYQRGATSQKTFDWGGGLSIGVQW